jgi:hypothetical protein
MDAEGTMPGRSGRSGGAAGRAPGDQPERDPVRERLESLRGDPGVRWHMSRHTLELAIGAFAGERPAERPASSKSRRRRRKKRFL